jgi:hypothetical protein
MHRQPGSAWIIARDGVQQHDARAPGQRADRFLQRATGPKGHEPSRIGARACDSPSGPMLEQHLATHDHRSDTEPGRDPSRDRQTTRKHTS